MHTLSFTDCTFHPNINNKSKELIRNKSAENFGIQTESREITQKYHKTRNNNRLKVCKSATHITWNFKPTVNEITELMTRTREYIKTDPFTRLSIERKENNNISKPPDKKRKSKFSFKDFYNRMTNHKSKHKNNIENNINKKSILKRSMRTMTDRKSVV